MTTTDLVAIIKRNPLIVGCGVLSLALAVGIYLRAGAIPETNAKLDEATAQARRYALNIANSAQLKDQYDAVVAANKAIDDRMIRASDIGINQQYFYKLESESGVKLNELHQSPPKRGAVSKGAFTPIAFTVSLQGDFTSVMKFVRSLEDGTHYCRVLSAACSGGRAGQVSLTLEIELLGRS